MTHRPAASVVISTYNSPRYLELVLAGYRRQDRADFEVLVADDGSTEATAALIGGLCRDGYPVPLRHVWQPDQGFRKARAVNLAILASHGERVVFTDGDTLPAADMVTRHLAAGAHASLVVGGHVRLDEATSAALDVEAILAGRHEALVSARDRREMWRWHLKNRFYMAVGRRRRPKVFGLNMSVDRATLLAVNGFDSNYVESSREDSDLRNRLRLYGATARCIWHRCIAVHMWHPETKGRRGWAEGSAYYKRADLEAWAPSGLRELEAEAEAGDVLVSATPS